MLEEDERWVSPGEGMRSEEARTIRYPFIVRQVVNDQGKPEWEAEVPDLPGCAAGADTFDQLAALLGDAIDDWIQAAREMGQDIPLPSDDEDYSGRVTVRMPRYLHRRLTQLAKLNDTSLNLFIVAALALKAGEVPTTLSAPAGTRSQSGPA
ncbi:MAG TPA: type II toxin-antitoxin system HicB family antitoxin [Bacillota bacterium]|jgi:predicted RNase H-like HicB family nuclease